MHHPLTHNYAEHLLKHGHAKSPELEATKAEAYDQRTSLLTEQHTAHTHIIWNINHMINTQSTIMCPNN